MFIILTMYKMRQTVRLGGRRSFRVGSRLLHVIYRDGPSLFFLFFAMGEIFTHLYPHSASAMIYFGFIQDSHFHFLKQDIDWARNLTASCYSIWQMFSLIMWVFASPAVSSRGLQVYRSARCMQTLSLSAIWLDLAMDIAITEKISVYMDNMVCVIPSPFSLALTIII